LAAAQLRDVRLPVGHMYSTDSELTRYRTFWPRFWAAFLDSGVLGPLQWIDILIWNSFTAAPVLLCWSFILLVASLTITVGMVAMYGQTPGKMACGIKIVSLDDSLVSLKQALLRDILGVLLGPVTFFIQCSNIFKGQLANRAMGSYQSLLWFGGAMMIWVFLEFITMLTNQRRRAIHDFIAGTVVVRDPSSKKNWILWLSITLFILNMIIPYFITDTNFVLRNR
jgi:uncharacterized RDD family membrane protein YckC